MIYPNSLKNWFLTKRKLITHSEEETLRLGARLAKLFPENTVAGFFGDLGAGKTTLIKGIISQIVGCSPDEINSPTFAYLNVYEGNRTVYHFDLYRLANSEEFVSMGFDEMFHAGGICCMEWSERVADILPEKMVRITLRHIGEHSRSIEIE